MKHKCINIDWLEVFCIEPMPLTPDYYEQQGYKVRVREYGTPVYRQMFTIYDGEVPIIEVRRDPYSLKAEGGIFEVGSCHLRLTNRACYRPEPVNDLRNFILAHGYFFKGITRLDICFDFELFDNRMKPRTLVNKLFANEVAKINQCNISAHGKDAWDGQVWNSLKWGSETSAVSTKLYNKTLELKTRTSKYYIVDSWEQAGLAKYGVVFDKNGQLKTKIMAADVDCTTPPQDDDVPEMEIWRVEFALKTEARNWLRTDTGEIFELRLTNIDTREKLLFLWRSLANHYFHFKTKVLTKDGKPQRKDRCPDLPLSKTSVLEETFKVVRIINQPDPTRTERILIKKLLRLVDSENVSDEDKEAALRVLGYFENNRSDTLLSAEMARLHSRQTTDHDEEEKPVRDKKSPSFILPSFNDPDLWEYPTIMKYDR